MSYLTSFEGGMAAVQEHNLAMAALAWRLLSAKQIPGTFTPTPDRPWLPSKLHLFVRALTRSLPQG